MSIKKFTTTRAVELRVAANGDTNTFEGRACVFDVVDSYGTTFRAGCFTAGGLDTNPYALLWQHNPDRPIGTFRAEEREDGLYIVGQWDMSTAGQEARQAAIGGSAGDLSVGFRWREDPNADQNEITIAELMEVSQVTSRFGAVPGSVLTAVRNALSVEEDTVEEIVEEVEEDTVEEIVETDNCSDCVDCACETEDTVGEPVEELDAEDRVEDDTHARSLKARALSALARVAASRIK